MAEHLTLENLREPVTALSDVHIGHALSLVRHPRELRPLFDEGGTILFNGDTFEQRLPDQAARAEDLRQALFAEAEAAGCEAVLIAGNHDPLITGRRAVFLPGPGILVTHGHAIFEGITPWSDKAGERARRGREIDAMQGRPDDPLAGLDGIERRLALANLLSIEADVDDIPLEASIWFKLGRYLSEFLHPERPWLVLKCWADTPRLAAAFAEQHLPGARFVIIGHTHFPGTWERRGRVVINTGSFALPLRRSATRIEGGRLKVAGIERKRGRFWFGRIMREFPLEPPGASPGAVSA